MGDGLNERMSRLALSFPALARAPGVSPWESDKFIRWVQKGGGSHGEKTCGKFVLLVWNNFDWGEKFNLAEAISVWDKENYKAFLEWVKNPWWA